MKKKGFTLIELLAVIIILAIIALLATPIILDVINDVRKEAFRVSSINIGHAAANKCDYFFNKDFKGLDVEYLDNVEISEDKVSDYYTGKSPDKGYVKVTEDCKTSFAFYDYKLKMCAYKDTSFSNPLLLDMENANDCKLDSTITPDNDYGSALLTGYVCSDLSIIPTEEKYFTFDQTTGTITGYDATGPKDVIIPCKIGGVNVTDIKNVAFASKGLTSVVMPETIKTIGDYAFYDNKINKLELGNSVEVIGSNAFEINQITELVFPDSLKTIESGFLNSQGTHGTFNRNPLQKVVFGSGIEYIGQYTFADLPSLKEVDFTRSTELKTIDSYAFDDTGITTLDLSNSLKLEKIGQRTFYNSAITELKLHGSNLTINESAFYSNLIENLELSGTITNIQNNAFKDNQLTNNYAYIYNSYEDGIPTGTTLTSYAGANRSSVKIPDDVTEITASFSELGLNGLLDTGNGITKVNTTMFSSNSLTEVIIGDNVKTIDDYAFYNNKIEKVKLGNSVEVIGSNAFEINKITELVFPDSLKTIESGFLNSQGTHGTFNRNPLQKVVFGSGIEYIGQYTFADLPSLKEVDFTRSTELKTIDSYAFDDTGITTLDLSNSTSLTKIGQRTFYNSTLKNVKLHGSNLTINESAFYSNLIENLELSGTITNIQNNAFKDNQLTNNYAYIYNSYEDGIPTGTTLTSYAGANRSSVKIPDDVTEITASFSELGLNGLLDTGNGITKVNTTMFSSNSLTEVIIGDNVKTIDDYAFYDNKIEKVKLGNSVEVIGSNAFEINKITELVFPDSLKTIESGFLNSQGTHGTFNRNPLQKVVFGSGIEYIGQYTFADLPSLKEVDFTRSTKLKTIDSYAFDDTGITTLDLSNSTSLTKIGQRTFYNSAITELKLHGSNLTINESAFYSNLIENLELSGTITNIQNNAFKDNQLTNNYAYIYNSYEDGIPTGTTLTSYAGANRSSVKIPDDVTEITASFSELGLNGLLDTGNGITKVNTTMFSSNSLTEVIIGDNVKTIDDYAFYNNKIEKVKLGNSVEVIGSNAFEINKITELVFPDSLKTIESGFLNSQGTHGTFNRNPLQKVVFGNGIEYIGQYTFADLPSLKEVDFTRSTELKKIDSYAFDDTGITTLDLSNSLKLEEIGQRTFYNSTLDNLILPMNLKTIGESAFYSNNLTSIDIPSGVTKISSNAFQNNVDLAKIFVKGKVDSSNFASLENAWNGTCNNIIYELASCYVYEGNSIVSYLDICSKNVEIPSELGGNKITTIKQSAFANKNITRLVIPSTITTIEDNAFAGNNIFPIIVMGKASEENFVSVGNNWSGGNDIIYENNKQTCFKVNGTTLEGMYNKENVCLNYTDVEIPNIVSIVVDSALQNKNITSIIIPSSVTSIGKDAFANNLLNSITVKDNTRLTTLGTNWNGNLYKVDFEGNSYDYNCFTLEGTKITNYKNYCKADVDLTKPIQNTYVNEIGDNAFKNAAINDNIIISQNILTIGSNAFEGNDLESVEIKNGLLEIKDNAFYNTGLLKIAIPSSVTTIGKNAFGQNDKLSSIIIYGKDNEQDFQYLGENWNGTCNNVIYNK